MMDGFEPPNLAEVGEGVGFAPAGMGGVGAGLAPARVGSAAERAAEELGPGDRGHGQLSIRLGERDAAARKAD